MPKITASGGATYEAGVTGPSPIVQADQPGGDFASLIIRTLALSLTAQRLTNLGTMVTKAAFTLPATTTGNIYTVAGGRVLVTSIVGLVTTVVQSQACRAKLLATPTVGSVNDLTDDVDINAAVLGSILSVGGGVFGDELVVTTGGGAPGLRSPLVVAAGTIGLNTSATNTGATSWLLSYIPLDDGATVVST